MWWMLYAAGAHVEIKVIAVANPSVHRKQASHKESHPWEGAGVPQGSGGEDIVLV